MLNFQDVSKEPRTKGEEAVNNIMDVFEYRGGEDHLYILQTQSSREHELPLTGFDYLKTLNLIVTADRSGCIRIWTGSKKFIREIQFPLDHQIDSVCFFNAQGDLLISHNSSISLVKFETYWTPTFSHWGITNKEHPTHVNFMKSADYDEDQDIVFDEGNPWSQAVRVS